MLDILHQDHLNISRLLNVLRDKLAALRSEKTIRFDLLKDALSYLSEVSDTRHHPREDLIYDYYVAYRCSDPTSVTSELKEQHKQIVSSGESLREMVDMILMDAVIPLEHVALALEQFIVLQQQHLDYEESIVFPLLRQAMTEDDWRHLEHNWANMTSDDPLFGRQVAERYQDLAMQLLSA
ncbi:MAG: hemerythrin domain-containing protein [Tolumonas sp.]|nr:hemerythrin domain-containing protein [Tolumonas sp.]